MARRSDWHGVRWALAATLAAGLTLTGCGSSLDEEDTAVYVRSVNLIGDAAGVRFLFGETTLADVEFMGGSSFAASRVGTRVLSFAALQPGELVDDEDDTNDEPIPLSGTFDQVLTGGNDYTLFAYGSMAAPQVLAVSGTQDRNSVSDNHAAVRLVNANASLGTAAIYLTAPQAGISSGQLIGTLAFGESTDYLDLTLERDADLIDTDSTLYADVTLVVVDESGSEVYRSEEIGVTEQTRVMFALVPNRGPGPAPTRVLELIPGGISAEYVAPGDQASVRIAHLSADTPTLDVLDSSFQAPVAQDVAFRALSADAAVESDEVSLIAVPSDNYGAFVFLEEFDASAGLRYTAYAAGPLATVDAVVLTDDARAVPTQTGFRFLNAAGSLADHSLDIYIVPSGETINLDEDDGVDDTAKHDAALAYRSATSYTTLKGGTYDVYFALADTTTVMLGPVPFTVDNGLVHTFALIDAEDGSLELMPVVDTR